LGHRADVLGWGSRPRGGDRKSPRRVTGGYTSAEALREALRDDTRDKLAMSAPGQIPA
jgi:hypothetical protein